MKPSELRGMQEGLLKRTPMYVTTPAELETYYHAMIHSIDGILSDCGVDLQPIDAINQSIRKWNLAQPTVNTKIYSNIPVANQVGFSCFSTVHAIYAPVLDEWIARWERIAARIAASKNEIW